MRQTLSLSLCSFIHPHYSLTLSNYFQCQPNSFTANHTFQDAQPTPFAFPPNPTVEPTLILLFLFSLLNLHTMVARYAPSSFMHTNSSPHRIHRQALPKRPFLMSQRLATTSNPMYNWNYWRAVTMVRRGLVMGMVTEGFGVAGAWPGTSLKS